MAFRPPVNRTMRVLSRPFFKQEHMISAARVFAAQNISRIAADLRRSRDRLYDNTPNLATVVPPPAPFNDALSAGQKCILLKPGIKHDDPGTWSETVHRLVSNGDMDVIPYKLQLSYDNWSMDEILEAILPESVHHEIPSAFNHAGHIAQLNLRDEYLPYKSIIAQVLLDKNPGVKTVINKTSTLDENEQGSVFRTLQYELLAGKDDMNVETKEHGATFRFDYAKVFWNSKLSNEHTRLVALFQPGQAVCDVMAGVGPFAVPAAKKGVFVWANDYNPQSYKYLQDAIALNKVTQFVKPFCTDGHDFIPASAGALLESNKSAKLATAPSKSDRKLPQHKLTNEEKANPNKAKPDKKSNRKPPPETSITLHQPKVFSHYIMNLPSTAPDFLKDFRGIYAGHQNLFAPQTSTKLPLIHCYCFVHGWDGAAGANNEDAKRQALERISNELGHPVRLADEDLQIHVVRNVAPTKFQLCVSFRLPAEVAFAV